MADHGPQEPQGSQGAGEGSDIPEPPPPSRSAALTHIGSSYSLGGGQDFYGIWRRAVVRKQPVWVYPRTPAGWRAAWTQFRSLEPKSSRAVSVKGIGGFLSRKRRSAE